MTDKMAMKSFSKRFEKLDVKDQLEALRLVHDADISAGTKEDVFLIFKSFLHAIPEMPEVLTECDEVMRVIRKQQS